MKLATEDREEAEAAKTMLGDLILFSIADGRCREPERCAGHYYDIMRGAFGEPTLLDAVKDKILGEDRTK